MSKEIEASPDAVEKILAETKAVAEIIRYAVKRAGGADAWEIAQRLLAAGYRLRAAVLEEAARVADARAEEWRNRRADLKRVGYGVKTLAKCEGRAAEAEDIARSLRALKEGPKT